MRYFKFILLIIICIFIYIYTDRLIKYSVNNNYILDEIDKYARVNNRYCIEGSISEEGIILGYNGILVDKEKSFSNMKGGLFNEDKLVFMRDECILNSRDNLDKYIISGNIHEKNISIVIDVVNHNYYEDMIKIFDEFNIKYNLMVNDYYEGSQTNLVYKGNNVDYFDSVICVYYDEDNLKECERKGFNTLKIVNYIDIDLFSNIKKFLNKGNIIFIKESYNNLNELRITLNYIKSRGFNVISVNELLF